MLDFQELKETSEFEDMVLRAKDARKTLSSIIDHLNTTCEVTPGHEFVVTEEGNIIERRLQPPKEA